MTSREGYLIIAAGLACCCFVLFLVVVQLQLPAAYSQGQSPAEGGGDSVTALASNDTFLKSTAMKARTLYAVLGGGQYYESKVNWSSPASVDEYRAIFDATMRMIKDEQTYDPGFEYNVPAGIELDPALTAYTRMLVTQGE